ncbi:MAG TPA: hypothetical protein PKE29_01890 [Phycisphaerales bacterium]|nr:hypothetical protein [Phycisphaerales bacterium]
MSAATNLRTTVRAEVVIVDTNTAEPVGAGDAQAPSTVTDAELFQAQTRAPDGPGAMLHEERIWPRLAAVLALIGLVAVGAWLYLRDGWGAATMGVVWLIMGYAVAWIVVWAAGLARVREQHEIERELDQRHRQG